MKNEEGNRLKLFMEREGLNQQQIAELIGKDRSEISKMMSGKVKIPLALWKVLHLKYKLNYSWIFHGTGTMKVKELENRKLMNDVTDILATQAMMVASIDQMRELLNKLVRDVYAK